MNVYAFITPIVVILLVLEIIYSVRVKNGKYPFQDTITNLGTGIGNQCINLGVAFFVYKWYGWLYEITPFEIPIVWYTLILLLLLQDFVFYWFHRIGHTINIFWAAHMAHHSSEEMNLSVGIRASFTQRLFQFLFFDWILVLIGFSPEAVYSMAAVHLLLAYWHHTAVINKMGWWEKFFVTPSHHRVHHGVNPQYIDKNFSEFLIIWDKWFGSFEEEVEEVCYGVTHPPRTWNPVHINFQFWKQLWDDAKETNYVWDKIRVWFMPLGWRPRDLEPYFSNGRIGYTKAEQTKFVSNPMKNSKNYLVAQVGIGILFLFFTINLQLPLIYWHRILLSIGVFGMIISWGAILESKRWAVSIEVLRILFMAISMVYVLHATGISSYQNWTTIAICFISGISILYFSLVVAKSKQEVFEQLV
ncbi:sterol desaturase/sphingolipid hydroxylase (fatty acid hydroxylase superfamily) [Tenacibaculum adriaticum]|uniref:Sterol desaturase/sphingolipid hydroxylase (Fatty acid hydroxylase superfamily) n=1 Tax=Tenacibaculum adriaticum TaxID=413713 RepID=A0A5S5DVZ1_9FLAO|nr:sterol desaturase family protein [Tenacibaculum adriaticum]TYP98809.1 sterol desaturase/sphingolipid hydroxylase (fatty acid hydroxylase superfamily) [Tenacibaculum adriaticum]